MAWHCITGPVWALQTWNELQKVAGRKWTCRVGIIQSTEVYWGVLQVIEGGRAAATYSCQLLLFSHCGQVCLIPPSAVIRSQNEAFFFSFFFLSPCLFSLLDFVQDRKLLCTTGLDCSTSFLKNLFNCNVIVSSSLTSCL